MNTHDFFFGHSGKSKRICVPQVSLPCKRKFFKVFLRLYFIDIDSLKFFRVKAVRHICKTLHLRFNHVQLFFIHLHIQAPYLQHTVTVITFYLQQAAPALSAASFNAWNFSGTRTLTAAIISSTVKPSIPLAAAAPRSTAFITFEEPSFAHSASVSTIINFPQCDLRYESISSALNDAPVKLAVTG